MSPFAPLLAAGDAELVKLVIIIVFGILVGIGKFYAMVKKGQPPAAMGQRPIPPPPVNVNAGNEIEEFMRRAAAKPRAAANAGRFVARRNRNFVRRPSSRCRLG